MSFKNCTHCGQALPLDAFPKDKSRPDGRAFYCKLYYQENNIRLRHGLTREEYDAYFRVGACAACGATDRRLVLDHCHATRKIRGVLCDHCNVALGRVEDSPVVLRALAAYIESH